MRREKVTVPVIGQIYFYLGWVSLYNGSYESYPKVSFDWAVYKEESSAWDCTIHKATESEKAHLRACIEAKCYVPRTSSFSNQENKIINDYKLY